MLDKLDKSSYIPYYVQIKHILLDRIQIGIYKEGQLIPSEADLAGQFSVTRTTVRKALDELKREGTIKTERGKGSVISADSKIEQSLQQFYRFGVEVGDTGVPAVSKVIIAEECIPPQDIIDMFTPRQGNTFYRIVRLRFFKDEPVSLESSYIPCSIAPDIISYDIRTDSLAGLLEREYGHKIAKATEFLYPRISDEYQSELLEIENHSPVFQTERQTKNTDDVTIEYRISIIRGDKVKFSTELY